MSYTIVQPGQISGGAVLSRSHLLGHGRVLVGEAETDAVHAMALIDWQVESRDERTGKFAHTGAGCLLGFPNFSPLKT